MTLEDEIEKAYPHLSREETVGILCMLVEAYEEIRNTVNFIVEQVLRGRMEGMQIDEKLTKTLKDFRIGKREIDNNLSDYWDKLHQVMYPEKEEIKSMGPVEVD